MLALGARERVFLLRVGMEEHGKIAAHRAEPGCRKHLGGGADDDPVAVPRGSAEEFVANGTPDPVDLHGLRAASVVVRQRPTCDR